MRSAGILHTRAPWRLSSFFSTVFSPALVLVVLVALSGIRAQLGFAAVLFLVVGVTVIPGVVYKTSKPLLAALNLSDHFRTSLVAALTLSATVVCYAIPVADPVPATVAALFFGNTALALARLKTNISAHVSVLTFALLWFVSHYGSKLWLILILSSLMTHARVRLGEHTVPEAMLGALLGVVTFCCFLLLQHSYHWS